jgi:hypothetical protein
MECFDEKVKIISNYDDLPKGPVIDYEGKKYLIDDKIVDLIKLNCYDDINKKYIINDKLNLSNLFFIINLMNIHVENTNKIINFIRNQKEYFKKSENTIKKKINIIYIDLNFNNCIYEYEYETYLLLHNNEWKEFNDMIL